MIYNIQRYWSTFFLLGSLLCVFASTVRSQDDIPYDRVIRVHWTETAPKLDGIREDEVWSQAEVASDFRIFLKPDQPSSLRTEVHALYDAENLYLFYTLYDDNMDKLQVGMPEDTRDVIDVSKDVAELFLDPGRTQQDYFQFCTTPLAARFDMRRRHGSPSQTFEYNPDWTVVPRLESDRWTLEIKIPFIELYFDDGVIATPQPGDEWGINFCRDQGYNDEWIYWSPTRSRSFHRPAEIGVAVFEAPRSAPPAPLLRLEAERGLQYGPGSLSLKVEGTAQDLDVEWTLLRDGQPADDARTDTSDPLTLGTHLVAGGFWDARVRVRRNGRLIFTGRATTRLPRVRETVDEIERELRQATELVQTLDHPSAAELRDNLVVLNAQVSPLAAQLAKPYELSYAEWVALAETLPSIQTLWDKAEYAVRRIAIYDADDSTRPAFAVGKAGSAERVFRQDVRSPVSEPVDLYIAGNERESFQLTIMPFWQDLSGVRIETEPLQGPGGTIPAENIEISRVDYVRLHDAHGGAWTPDPLYPYSPFDVPADRTQPVWFDVLRPPGRVPGVYDGSVHIVTDETRVTVPLRVHALGFDIPLHNTLDFDPWFMPFITWRSYYPNKMFQFTPELYERWLKVLARYRHACYPMDTRIQWQLIKAWKEVDGSITFDFSGLDWMLEMGAAYGANWFGASFTCNASALFPFAGYSKRIPLLDRATGERIGLLDEQLGDLWQFERGVTRKPDFLTNPIYLRFLTQYEDYLRSRSMLDRTDYKIYDEPKTRDEFAEVVQMHNFFKLFVPGFKRMSFGVGPIEHKGLPSVGSMEVWAPILGAVTPELAEAMHERKKHGERAWFYTCGAARTADGRTTPYIVLHQSLLGARMHGWIAWKIDADGFLIFAMSQLPGKNLEEDPARRYTNPLWQLGPTDGQGFLVYPGSNMDIIPSIRLAAVRDGLEDFEYFHLLRELSKKLDPERDTEVLESVQAALKIPDEILTWNWFDWTRNPDDLQAHRLLLAEQIRIVKEALATRPGGTDTR